MSHRFRLILRVIWFLVWRLAASALVGLAAFYLLPPLKEQYGGAADNVNLSFHIIVRSDNDSGWAVKRWEEFDAGRDRVWTETLESDYCERLKVICRLDKVGADEYELVRTDPVGTQVSRYRLENARPKLLAYTADSVFARMAAGLICAVIALLLTLIPPFYRLWRRDKEIQAAARR